ncbi:MAG TPA: hypothetical protein VL970_08515 [Candidatus Acidoferrales bacterium]|nr:hypothetical protein [Candidatus Acidoferrales bacterium]
MKLCATQFWLVLLLAALATVMTGCSSTEPDNASVRPWNSPEGWQGGAMDGLMDQYHR